MDLDAIDLRILGSLLEKEKTTPNVYPLSLNALAAACNQTTSRDPVMELDEPAIARHLTRLQSAKLVFEVIGGRVTRWQHNIDRQWALASGERAVMTLLLLRGPQTAGELRARSDRLHPFRSIEEVEQQLELLRSRPEPLVAMTQRSPGQKEERWCHTLLPESAVAEASAPTPRRERDESLAARVASLEAAADRLENAIQDLVSRLGA